MFSTVLDCDIILLVLVLQHRYNSDFAKHFNLLSTTDNQ